MVRDSPPSSDGHVLIELTKRCNYFCRHCFTNGGRALDSEMDFASLERTLNLLSRAGFTDVTLSGGDPSLREDFVDIALFSKKTGLSTHVFSTLISDAQIEPLKDFVSIFATSLDGKPEHHNWIRGTDHAFEDTLKLLGSLRDMHCRSQVQMTVLENNLGDVDFVAGTCLDHHVERLKISHVSNMGRAVHLPEMLKGSLGLMEKILRKAHELNSSLPDKLRVNTNLQSVRELKTRPSLFKTLKIHILSDGTILPYLGVDRKWSLGNVTDISSFEKALSSPKATVAQDMVRKTWSHLVSNYPNDNFVAFDDAVGEVFKESLFQ